MAIKLKISHSKVSADTMASQREREEAKLAAEGYRFYAQEASEFAAAGLRAVSEALGCGGLRRIDHIPCAVDAAGRFRLDHK